MHNYACNEKNVVAVAQSIARGEYKSRAYILILYA